MSAFLGGMAACVLALLLIVVCYGQCQVIVRQNKVRAALEEVYSKNMQVLLDDSRKAHHDRLHYGFTAAVCSALVRKHGGASVSITTKPELMALNAMFTNGHIIAPGKIASQRQLFPGVSLDLDERNGVVGVEVVGYENPEEEERQPWEDSDGD